MSSCMMGGGCPLGKFGMGLLVIAGTVATFGFIGEPEKKPAATKPDAPKAAPTTPAPTTPATTDGKKTTEKEPTSFFDFSMKTIDGETQSLSTYKGKVILVVNTASKCGYTPQYEGLQKLYTDNKDKGLVVLGFPSNDFGGQEPGSASEIKSFCTSKYNVTFPMFDKIVVSGANPDPLYKWLSAQKAGGPMTPKWNFSKYLVDQNGQVVAGYSSKVTPDDKAMNAKIAELLKAGSKAAEPKKEATPATAPTHAPKAPTEKK